MSKKARHIITPIANFVAYLLSYTIINVLIELLMGFIVMTQDNNFPIIIMFFRYMTCSTVGVVTMSFVSLHLPPGSHAKHFLWLTACLLVMSIISTIISTIETYKFIGEIVGIILGGFIGYVLIRQYDDEYY